MIKGVWRVNRLGGHELGGSHHRRPLVFRYSGDVGGFRVSSDLIWNAFGGFGY